MNQSLSEKVKERLEQVKASISEMEERERIARRDYTILVDSLDFQRRRLKDLERMAVNYTLVGERAPICAAPTTEETRVLAESNVAEFGAGESGKRAVADMKDREEQQREYERNAAARNAQWQALAAYNPDVNGEVRAFILGVVPGLGADEVGRVADNIARGVYVREVRKLDEEAAILAALTKS